MRLFIRIFLSAALVVADAAQATSIMAAEGGGKPAVGAPSSYQSHAQSVVEKNESAWKRISASICTGCGSPPPPSPG